MISTRVKTFTALCLSCLLLAGCSNSQTNKFFNSDSTVSQTSQAEGTIELGAETEDTVQAEDTSSIAPDEDKIYPDVTTFFNSGTHPDIFYIKSTGFDYTRKTDEVKAIITEGYITDGDKITGCYMRIYPMIGFSGAVFDTYTNGLYSFADFERQEDGSFQLNITGEVLENIQQLSASTSMALLAGKAVAEGLTVLDESGNIYTVVNGNLVLVTEDGLAYIPEASTDEGTAEGTTSEAQSEDTNNQD